MIVTMPGPSEENFVKAVESFRGQMTEDFTKKIHGEFGDLEDLIEDINNKGRLGKRASVPEYIFRDVFLPILHGDVVLKNGATIQHWAALSQGYNYPVDVLNEKGQVIFTTPPYFDTNIYNLEKMEITKSNFSQMAMFANTLSNSGLGRGAAVLKDYTNEAMSKLADVNVLLDNVKAWNDIYKRYNLSTIDITGIDDDGKNNPTGTSNVITSGDDDTVYE